MKNNLPLRIALRYLFSKKSHKAVNIISAISIAGVAVATAAIVVVLSVFNGFERLSARQLSRVNPDFKITATTGKAIVGADSLASVLSKIEGVKAVVPTIIERGMLIDNYSQLPIVFKGIGDGYENIIAMDSIVIDGFFTESIDTLAAIQLSVGVANRTGLRPSYGEMVNIYVPRRQGRLNPANPLTSFKTKEFVVTSVIETENAAEDNDRVVIPLETARELLDYKTEATNLELAVAADANHEKIMDDLTDMLGPDYQVLNRSMQQEESFRMIEIEKWVTFMMLFFILIIAAFNIVSTLSLLVAEKKDDVKTLRSLGSSKTMIRKIFIFQGFLITVIGGVAGIVAGVILSLVQQHFGLIKLAGDPAALTIDVYPVAVEFIDVVTVMCAVVLVALMTSQLTRIFIKRI